MFFKSKIDLHFNELAISIGILLQGLLFTSCTGIAPSASTLSVSSATLSGNTLTLSGKNLSQIQSLKLTDKNGTTAPLSLSNQTDSSLTASFTSAANFISGTLYNLIITSANGDTITPINVTVSTAGNLSAAGNVLIGSTTSDIQGVSLFAGPNGGHVVNALGVFPGWDPNWLYLNGYATKEGGLGITFSDGIKLVGNVLISGKDLQYIPPAQTALQVQGEITPATDNTYSLGTSTFQFTSVYATGGVITTSDIREKKFVEDSNLGLSLINQLRPVSYYWKKGSDHGIHYGLIAQEARKAILESLSLSAESEDLPIIHYSKETDRYAIRYTELIAPLIKSVQELFSNWKTDHDRIHQLEEENTQLKKRLEQLEKRFN